MTRKWILTEYDKQFKIMKFSDETPTREERGDKKTEADQCYPVEVGTEDEDLPCNTCKKNFIFTVGEQQYYHDKKVGRKPENCKSCRDDFKRMAKTTPCSDLAKGHCKYGKSCRFMHPEDEAAPIDDSVDENAWTGDAEFAEAVEKLEASGRAFGTHESSPYEMDAAAIVQMCDAAGEEEMLAFSDVTDDDD